MAKSYRGRLPKPDKNGDVRPEVGGKRITVGNIRDVSTGEMERRLDAISMTALGKTGRSSAGFRSAAATFIRCPISMLVVFVDGCQ